MKGLAILMWMSAVLVAILILAGCAPAPEPVWQSFKNGSEIKYAEGVSSKWQPYVAYGDCTNFAATYQAELPGSTIMTCVVWVKRFPVKHAYVVYEGWILDNMYTMPVKNNACNPTTVRRWK